ncbi:RNA chaperone Hfq [Bryobacter aggregatus]|uniref:RNA chaperone Hfq n=1 Tax=Bryobacter aggregatus TaxID=360054 RepID=UPI0004E0C387|nr:RNA chaperone Hfq [Bryobacter aggregatus]
MDTPIRRSLRAPISESREKPNSSVKSASTAAPKKQIPPDQTNAENFYYIKQMNTKTPMVIVLNDGEELHGVIEWYDKGSLKVNRDGEPNLLVYKSSIKYMYKDEDDED